MSFVFDQKNFNILLEILVLQFLSDFQQEPFWQIKRNVLGKTTFYLSSLIFRREFLPWKSQFYNGSKTEIRSESLRKLGEFFKAWLSKLHSTCLEEFSGGNFFWCKINSVTLFVLWQIFCQTFDNIFIAVLSQ